MKVDTPDNKQHFTTQLIRDAFLNLDSIAAIAKKVEWSEQSYEA